MADLLRDIPTLPEAPTMIDVGAHHGAALAPFLSMGWRVHAFEPDKANRESLLKRHGSNPRLTVDPRAVSDRNTTRHPFYTSAISTGISSLSPFDSSHVPAGTVDTITLSTYCSEAQIDFIEFLKIDTEGFDLFVLKGIEWDVIRPRVIVCEFEDKKTKPLGYDFADLVTYLSNLQYSLWISEWHPVIRYGQQHSWKGIYRHPHELSDADSWGNILAFAPSLTTYGVEAAVLNRVKGLERPESP